MAEKLPSLYSPDPEDQDLITEIKDQYKDLSQSLKSRKMPFDPQLMAIAQGFLAPTQTGSFGESLGNAAKGYTESAIAEEKTARERAALRLQLAQGELGQRQATRKARTAQQILMGLPATGGAPVTEGAGSTTGATGAQIVDTPPKGLRDFTMGDVRAAMVSDETLGKQVSDIFKLQGDRYKIAMNGTVYDTVDKKYVTGLQIPGQTPSSFVIPEVGGKLTMLPWQYDQYQTAREGGMGKEWVSNFMSASPVPAAQLKKAPVTPAPGSAPVSGTTPVDLTEAGLAAQAKALETTATERAKGENTRFQTIVNNAETAGSRQSMYNALGSIAKRPDAVQILGVFENNDFSSALFKLVETSGKGLPQVNEIREIFTNFGLDKTLKADQLAAAQLIAQINLDLRKISRTPGEGAYSDLETNMMLAAGPSMKDTPLGLQKKLALLNARAEFEKTVSRTLLDSGMDADKFKRSSQYDKLLSGYDQKLIDIIFPNQKVVPPPARTPTIDDVKRSQEKKRGKN